MYTIDYNSSVKELQNIRLNDKVTDINDDTKGVVVEIKHSHVLVDFSRSEYVFSFVVQSESLTQGTIDISITTSF